MINALSILFGWIYIVWVSCACTIDIAKTLGNHPPDWVYLVVGLLKWPTLIGVLLQPVFTVLLNGRMSPLDIVWLVLQLAAWWAHRDDGDDWKKKLKARTDAVVRRFEGRLIVVPQGA